MNAETEMNDFFDRLDGKEPEVQQETNTEVPAEDVPNEGQEAPATPEVEEKQKPDNKEFNIKDYFPDYDSVDAIKDVLEKVKTYPKEDEIKALKDKATKFDSHNEFIEKLRATGLNEKYLKLNALEADKSEKADTYKKLLFGSTNDIDLIKLDLLDKYPELKDDDEMLQFQLEEKYPHIFDEDADTEDADFIKEKKKLKFEATQIHKRLLSEFDSISLPEALQPDYEKKQVEKVLDTWKDNFEQESKDFLNLSVEVEGDKFMDIKIPDKDKKEYINNAIVFIAQNKLAHSKEALQKVNEYVRAMYIAKNLPAYNKAILDKRAEMSDEQWRKFIHNPKPVDNTTPPKEEETDDFGSFLNRLDS